MLYHLHEQINLFLLLLHALLHLFTGNRLSHGSRSRILRYLIKEPIELFVDAIIVTPTKLAIDFRGELAIGADP
jgi:hypothetical protein